MREPGYIALHRSVWEHPSFAPEPFTEREAWIWLVSTAAWVEKRVRIGSSVIELKRGQLAFATRFLAQKWRWAHSRVVRFLFRLENDTMVSTQATRQSTLITICNYDKYQFSRNADETQIGTPTGTRAEHARNKEEELNNITTNIPRAPALIFETDWPKDYRELFWQAYPKRVDRASALRKLDQIRRAGDLPWATLLGGVKRYAASVRGTDPKYIKGPAAWLNAGKWDDEIVTKSSVFYSNKMEGIL